jgi:hypothetical protein
VIQRVIHRYLHWAAALSILMMCLAGGISLAGAVRLPSGDEFNVLEWELRNAPGKWLYLGGRILHGRLSQAEEDARLGRYILLTARIEQLKRDGASQPEIDRLRDERDGLENDVEAVLEGRLTTLLEEQGLESSLPLFPDARLVFPPVDVELDDTPHVLAVSPRDRIELVEQRAIRADLGPDDAGEIEAEVEAGGTRSALVDGLAGMSLYPSVVAPRTSYAALAETTAHEWVHNYLSLKPLGIRYLSSLELRTLNETVADIVGQELGAQLTERYPLAEPYASQLAALAPDALVVDVGAALRQLRIDVDALLAQGQIDRAEALMEQRRRELADQGAYFRRINQAFFAFRNIYATDPASTDPIGEKLGTLREREGSTGAFLRAAAQLTSAAALDRLLETTAAGGTERR